MAVCDRHRHLRRAGVAGIALWIDAVAEPEIDSLKQ
jgi:hypothetical protein